jgi:hypothetical protein
MRFIPRCRNITPKTEAIAAIQENSPDPNDSATAVKAGSILCGKDIGLAFLNQNRSVFILYYQITAQS